MRRQGHLDGEAVVVTTMTNLGFRRAMAAEGIEVRWTDVGDRYVLEEMRRGLRARRRAERARHQPAPRPLGRRPGRWPPPARGPGGPRRTLAEAGRVMERLPQRLVNVLVERKGDLAGAEALWAAVRECEAALGEDGRVVVRVGHRTARAGHGRGPDGR